MTRRKRTLAGLAACTVAALTASACGSSGNAAGGSGGVASGDSKAAITIGTFSSATGQGLTAPEAHSGAQAAVDVINAAGGVNGHQLKLDFCDTKFDPNQEAACARQMVTDKVSVVVGPQLFFAQNSLPILQRGNVPVLASNGLSPAELQSPVVFPLGGIPGWYYGTVAMMKQAGVKRISVLANNNVASQFAIQTVLDAANAAGLTLTNKVSVDPTTTDFASAAAQATKDNPDGIVVAMAPQAALPAIQAVRASGYKGIIGSITDVVSQKSVTALGSNAEGMLLTSLLALPTDPNNASSVDFNTTMAKYAPGARLNGLSYLPWTAVQLFAKIVAGSDKFDPASVLTLLKAMPKTDLAAVGSYQVQGVKSPLSKLPQLFHPQVQRAIVKNGQIVDDGGFFDPFSVISS